MRWLCAILLASLSSLLASAQGEIRVPHGRPVLLDGTAEPGEWTDANATALSGGIRFYVKQSEQYLWLAIELPAGNDGAIDLYISPSLSEIYDLHASAKLGERKLSNGKWAEWEWWNNRSWVANTSRVDSFEKASFLPTNVREYQIRIDKFAERKWKVMFELLTPAKPEWKTTAYPEHASNSNTKNWWTLNLEGQ